MRYERERERRPGDAHTHTLALINTPTRTHRRDVTCVRARPASDLSLSLSLSAHAPMDGLLPRYVTKLMMMRVLRAQHERKERRTDTLVVLKAEIDYFSDPIRSQPSCYFVKTAKYLHSSSRPTDLKLSNPKNYYLVRFSFTYKVSQQNVYTILTDLVLL